jgi:hypothetical protein
MTDLLGGITILESDGTDNQDWVGAGGDPDTVDTDNFTVGTDLIHIWTQNTDPGWKTKINKSTFPGAFQIATPLEENDDMMVVTGFVTDLATRNLIMKFAANHNNIADKPVYLVSRHGANSYEQFADSNRAMKDYVHGYITDVKRPFAQSENKFNVTIIFQIVWS